MFSMEGEVVNVERDVSIHLEGQKSKSTAKQLQHAQPHISHSRCSLQCHL